VVVALNISGCQFVPSAPSTPPTPDTLVYDAPVTLSVKNGTVLPGTTIGYGGKTLTGAAKLLLAGQTAIKQMGDTLDWEGSPAPKTNLKLSTRVVTFDDQTVNLVGAAHIELSSPVIQPGAVTGASQMEFNAPVTYSVRKGNAIPGTKVLYMGSTNNGAQFGGVEGYPYRKVLDSLQYTGRLNPKATVKLDLRVLSYSDADTLLAGTANLKFEP
jgi:hypothetical protein